MTPMPSIPTVSPSRARRGALLALLAGGALALSACAGLQPQAPEEIVAQRAEQRWDALIASDYDKAWTFTQPGYRAVVKQADYGKQFGGAGRWKGAQIHGVKCEAERCTVTVRLEVTVSLPQFRGMEVASYVDEQWVREDGQWWYYQPL